MPPDENDKNNDLKRPEQSFSSIDLGDDLLNTTQVLNRPTLQAKSQEASVPDVTPSQTLEPTLENARILKREGLQEEAKKILRQILLKDPGEVEAHQLLEEIHKRELRELFAAEESSQRTSYGHPPIDDSMLDGDPDEIFKSLDREFDIGESHSQEEIVFPNLDLEVAGAGAQDRLDLAISFIEMELYTHAKQLLRTIIRSSELPQNAISLLAFVFLLEDAPYEAISILQPYLNAADINLEEKIEFFYLMARANQAANRKSEALAWYRQVLEVASGYRDSAERIEKLLHD